MGIFDISGKTREVTKWKKDHETGLYLESKCLKPAQSLQGRCLVELFDGDTGKKKEELYTENVICNSLNKYAMQLFGIDALINKNSAMGTKMTIVNPFGNIFLTDYTGAESASTKRLLGNVVGWASKYTGYVGSDTLRGTINDAEKDTADASTIKFVFDWPTHSGNGTFQSIFWMPGKPVTITTSPARRGAAAYLDYDTTTTDPVQIYSRICIKDDDIYYTAAGGKIYKLTNPLWSSYVYAASGSESQHKDFSGTDNNLCGIDWDGTNFWTFGDQNDKMYKLDTSGAEVSSWSITKATYFDSRIRFCCFGGKIYTFKRVDTTTWNLYKFATDGTLEATYNLYSASRNITDAEINSDNCALTDDGDNMFLIYETGSSDSLGVILEFDGSGNVLYDYEIDWQTAGVMYGACWDRDRKIYIAQQGSGGSFSPNWFMLEPVAQTLLPSGVTKTNTQTMKVTYTFDLDLSSF